MTQPNFSDKYQVLNIVEICNTKFGTFAIWKVKKAGTDRVFFVPAIESGKRITNTLFARKYDAKNAGVNCLRSLASN